MNKRKLLRRHSCPPVVNGEGVRARVRHLYKFLYAQYVFILRSSSQRKVQRSRPDIRRMNKASFPLASPFCARTRATLLSHFPGGFRANKCATCSRTTIHGAADACACRAVLTRNTSPVNANENVTLRSPFRPASLPRDSIRCLETAAKRIF